MSRVVSRNAFAAVLGLVLVSAAAPIALADAPGYLFREVGASTNASDNARIAADTQIAPEKQNAYVNGRYHSVMNGIPDYDGFDRFRNANGQPLPGWQEELSSPG